MAVESEHEEYKEKKVQWSKLRDCADGQEIIHGKKEMYLPRLSEQSDNDYKAYLSRTSFYGATARTIDGLSGMVFRKPPLIDVPNSLKPFLKDVTLNGLSLTGFAEEVVDDIITVGRAGILVDYPTSTGNTTVAVAESMNIRPFLKQYTAEQIFNWSVASINNIQVVTQVRLWEWVSETDSEFETKIVKQIRVLDLNKNGHYRQRVYIEKGATNSAIKTWTQDLSIGDIVPLKAGVPLDFIPFFFVGVKNGSSNIEKPPLIDLANTNLSHYTSTADLEHGAHFTGLPTAIITGHQINPEAPEVYKIGGDSAWVFPEPDAKAFFLEFQGHGLEALEKRVAKKEEYMSYLGARMLSPGKKGVEAVETTQMNRLAEMSILSSLVQSASEAIEKALVVMADWSNIAGDVSFKLNSDFLAVTMTPQQLQALMMTWQQGGIAYSDLLVKLKQGEIVQDSRREDEIRSEIETENPFNSDDLTGE